MGKVYTIYLTTECNFQCTYCYEEYTKCLILDKEMLKDILDFIIDLESNKDSDAFAVNFMGGEPLLKKELIYQAVNYIKEKCKKKVLYYITTNGSLLNEEMISWMKENDFFVRISIDGNKETHKKNRLQKDGNSAYATIMQNLKFIKNGMIWFSYRTYENQAELFIDSDMDFVHWKQIGMKIKESCYKNVNQNKMTHYLMT